MYNIKLYLLTASFAELFVADGCALSMRDLMSQGRHEVLPEKDTEIMVVLLVVVDMINTAIEGEIPFMHSFLCSELSFAHPMTW